MSTYIVNSDNGAKAIALSIESPALMTKPLSAPDSVTVYVPWPCKEKLGSNGTMYILEMDNGVRFDFLGAGRLFKEPICEVGKIAMQRLVIKRDGPAMLTMP